MLKTVFHMSTLSLRMRRCISLLACGLLVHAHALAQEKPRPFPEVGVYEIGSATALGWSELRPATFHVVMLLSAYEPSSEALVEALSADGVYAGEGLVVFVEGSQEQVDAFTKERSGLLPKSRWMRVSHDAAAIAFRQSGTPQLHGVDPQGNAVWLVAGVPQPKARARSMVSGWTRRSALPNQIPLAPK